MPICKASFGVPPKIVALADNYTAGSSRAATIPALSENARAGFGPARLREGNSGRWSASRERIPADQDAPTLFKQLMRLMACYFRSDASSIAASVPGTDDPMIQGVGGRRATAYQPRA